MGSVGVAQPASCKHKNGSDSCLPGFETQIPLKLEFSSPRAWFCASLKLSWRWGQHPVPCRKAQWGEYVKEHQNAVCDPQIQSCPSLGQCPTHKEGAGMGLMQSSPGNALLAGREFTVPLCRRTQERSPGMVNMSKMQHGNLSEAESRGNSSGWQQHGRVRGAVREAHANSLLQSWKRGSSLATPAAAAATATEQRRLSCPQPPSWGEHHQKQGILVLKCSNNISYQKGFLDYFPAKCKPLQ